MLLMTNINCYFDSGIMPYSLIEKSVILERSLINRIIGVREQLGYKKGVYQILVDALTLQFFVDFFADAIYHTYNKSISHTERTIVVAHSCISPALRKSL